ncbi:MAG TPA: ABC transporter permease [Kofleriaceae bacterium]|nr:ABC transporter permease [Kofleriaceae bacterium]
MNAPPTPPAPVTVPPRSFRSDLRAVRIVWLRDMIRFWHDKPRIIASALQPMLYLFVFGTGMGAGMRPSAGLDLRVFLFPGVMAMATLFTCFFSAGSLVWDREFGFMREMLVAPVRRSAIVVGKAFGGATTGMFQGLTVLAVGGLIGVPYSFTMIVTLIGMLAVLSFAITSIGVLVAVKIKSFQAFMALVQIIIMPMFFLSGALFPLRDLPTWLNILTRLDPLTYAVDPMRRTVLSHVSQVNAQAFGVTWSDYTVPTLLELGIVLAFGIAALAIAARAFGKTE